MKNVNAVTLEKLVIEVMDANHQRDIEIMIDIFEHSTVDDVLDTEEAYNIFIDNDFDSVYTFDHFLSMNLFKAIPMSILVYIMKETLESQERYELYETKVIETLSLEETEEKELLVDSLDGAKDSYPHWLAKEAAKIAKEVGESSTCLCNQSVEAQGKQTEEVDKRLQAVESILERINEHTEIKQEDDIGKRLQSIFSRFEPKPADEEFLPEEDYTLIYEDYDVIVMVNNDGEYVIEFADGPEVHTSQFIEGSIAVDHDGLTVVILEDSSDVFVVVSPEDSRFNPHDVDFISTKFENGVETEYYVVYKQLDATAHFYDNSRMVEIDVECYPTIVMDLMG